MMALTRKKFLGSLGLGVAGLALGRAASGAPEAGATRRPNVVLFLTDDQRPDAIGALGNPNVRTPHIDSLYRRGFAFRKAYCMGSMGGAVCMPSRTMLLTGKSLFHAKDAASGADPATWTFPRAMKEAGYATMRTGKKGNHPARICAEFGEYIEIPRAERCGEQHADNGIRFIREHAGQRPFFLLIAFATPHDPQPAPAEYHARFKAGDLPLPDRFLAQHPFDNGAMETRDEKTLPWPRTRETVTGKFARYYASLAYTDAQIGRVLAALAEAGQGDNTVFVFASDNGLSMGDHGLTGKQNIYEDGGMSVPLAFAGPGVPRGESAAFAYLFDVFPTVCALTGAPTPAGVEGRDLSPVMRGEATGVRDTVFLAYGTVQRSLRDDRWKIIRYPKINKTQLFDLKADPLEQRDLAGMPEHAATEQAMLARLAEAQKQLDDPHPLTSEKPADPSWSPRKSSGVSEGVPTAKQEQRKARQDAQKSL